MILGLWLMLGVRSLRVLGSCMSHCFLPVLMYGNETMILKEDRSSIRAVQMDNLRDWLVSGEWIKSRMHG